MLRLVSRATPAFADRIDPSTPNDASNETAEADDVHSVLAATKVAEALEHHVLGKVLRCLTRQELAGITKGKSGDFGEK